MLTSDPSGELRRLTTPAGEPIAEARDLKGELHRLWRVTDEATVRRVRELMATRQVIIADGHHRYETAVAYAEDRKSTRLKSSHANISYAVFCLKKKTRKRLLAAS